jgi:hypothetical protein
MRGRGWLVVMLAGLGGVAGALSLAPARPVAADASLRYSGHVVDVDLRRGVLIVEELGRRGLPVRHHVKVEAETPVVTTTRLRLGDMRGRSAFGEMSVSLVDVMVGDFVVVEGDDLDGETVARRVTIVETRRVQ